MGKDSGLPSKQPVTEKEAEDFLRKVNEYKVVEQLNKAPANISLLALLLSSETHRNAVLKVLNEAHVPNTISVDDVSNMIGMILNTHQITFSDDELTPDGTGHIKALHITVKTLGMILAKVLVDNGSALNICPWVTLERMGIGRERVKGNGMLVRAFDGSRRPTLGSLPLEIGPCIFNVTFQVLDIPAAYNLLLRRRLSRSTKPLSLLHFML